MCRTLTVRIEDKLTDDALSSVMNHFDVKTATKAIQQLILTHKLNIDLIEEQNKEIERLKNEMERNNTTIKNYLSAKKALDKLKL